MIKIHFDKIEKNPKLQKLVQENDLIKEGLVDLNSRMSCLPDDYVLSNTEQELLVQLNDLIDSGLATKHLWEKLLTKIKVQCKFIEDNSEQKIKEVFKRANEVIDDFLESAPIISERKNNGFRRRDLYENGSILIAIIITLYLMFSFFYSVVSPQTQNFYWFSANEGFKIIYLILGLVFLADKTLTEYGTPYSLKLTIFLSLLINGFYFDKILIALSIISVVLTYLWNKSYYGERDLNVIAYDRYKKEFNLTINEDLLKLNLPDSYWKQILLGLDLIKESNKSNYKENKTLIRETLCATSDKIKVYNRLSKKL